MSGLEARPPIRAVAETHAAIWYLFADPRLSPDAYTFMTAVDAGGDRIALSSITFVEVVYLSEKGRIRATTFSGLRAELDRPDPVFVEVAVDVHVAQAMSLIARSDVPDMPDRIIAATALHLQVPVISRDGKIRLSSVRTIW